LANICYLQNRPPPMQNLAEPAADAPGAAAKSDAPQSV